MQSETKDFPSEEVFTVEGRLWSDGWFLYARGAVHGPFAAKEIFAHLPQGSHPSKLHLVARKGFQSWYDFTALTQLYSEERVALAPSGPQAGVHMQGVGQGGPRLVAARKRLGPTLHGLAPEAKQLAREVAEAWEEQAAPPAGLASLAGESARRAPERSFEYYHMVLRGSLRLGRIISPWWLVCLKFPLSLGLVWRSWYEQALMEAVYHLDDPWAHEMVGHRQWLAMIPGFHLFAAYRLAKLILQMEVQNQYKRTSPTLAFFLSLLPPLAMFYLQQGLNRHWSLHVRHSIHSGQLF